MPSLSNSDVTVTVKAVDQASDKFRGVSQSLDGLSGASDRGATAAQKLRENWAPIGAITLAAGRAFQGVVGFLDDSIDSANKLTSALTGLDTISRAYGQSSVETKKAAQDLAKDGLLTVADAANALKNLLSSGFSLPEAIQLLKGLKDQAAFNRQGFYDLGGAVVATTEGIKNGNSVLADATGTTKNLSVMVKEAGISIDRMGSISQDAAVRQAILNGFLESTSKSAGDAERYSKTYAGQQLKAAAATERLRQSVGFALQTALLPLIERLGPIISAIGQWTQEHPHLTAVIALTVAGILALTAAIGAAATAVWAFTAALGALQAIMSGPLSLAIKAVTVVGGLLVTTWASMTGHADSLSRAQDKLRDSTDKLNDASEKYKESGLQIQRAQLNLERSQANYNDAVKKYGVNSMEAREASINLQQAQLDLNDAVKENIKDQKDLSAAIKQRKKDDEAYKKSAESRAWSEKIFGDEVRRTNNALDETIKKTQQRNDKIQVNPTYRSLNDILSGKRALGGPVLSGRSYLVGEEGPEIFTPSSTGQILSHGDSSRQIAASGSPTVNIGTVHVHNEADEKRLIRNIGFRLQLA